MILHLIKTDLLIFQKSRKHLNSIGVWKLRSSKVPYWKPTNVRRRGTKFIRPCEMASHICAPVLSKTLFMLLGLLFCSPFWLLVSKILWKRFTIFFKFPPSNCKPPNYMPMKAQTRFGGIFLTHSQPDIRRHVVRTRFWRLHPTWKTRYLLYVGWVFPRVELDGMESLALSGIRPPDSFIPRKTLRIRHGHF